MNITTDETNLSIVNFTLYNDSGLVSSQVFTNLTTNYNFTGLNDGTYYYNVTILDQATNRNSTETRWINVTGNDPSIEFTDPTTSAGTNIQDYIEATALCSDVFGIENCTITLADSDNTIINETMSLTSPVSENYTGLSAGNYTLNASALDQSGNRIVITRSITLASAGTGGFICDMVVEAVAVNSFTINIRYASRDTNGEFEDRNWTPECYDSQNNKITDANFTHNGTGRYYAQLAVVRGGHCYFISSGCAVGLVEWQNPATAGGQSGSGNETTALYKVTMSSSNHC
jgi:hypothetical protein